MAPIISIDWSVLILRETTPLFSIVNHRSMKFSAAITNQYSQIYCKMETNHFLLCGVMSKKGEIYRERGKRERSV